jgi:anti-sigma factor RsiW
MTDCEHVRLDLGGYVLGGLEPEEAAAVREHLGSCPRCIAEHARVAELPALLSLAEGLEDAPAPAPALEERVLDAFAHEHARARPRSAPWSPRRVAWLRPRVLVPAGAALAAAAIALVVVLGGSGEQAVPGYPVALHAVAGQAGSGDARLESVAGGTALHLWVRDLPADPSAVYEVECDAPDWSASAGTFRTDTHGRAYVVLTTAARRGEYDAIRIVRRTTAGASDVMTAQLN